MNQMTRLVPAPLPDLPDPDVCWAAFLRRDRAMDGDVAMAVQLVRSGKLLTAARHSLL